MSLHTLLRPPTTIVFLAAILPACSDYGLEEGTEINKGPQVATDVLVTDESSLPDLPTDTPRTPRDDAEVVDRVVQPAEFSVDVLWVVDNSCSMEDDQDSLTAAFPAFIDYFSKLEGIDYHIGVVSTDVEDANHDGKLRQANGVRWIEVDTPNKLATFTAMAGMGTSGSGDEAGRAAAYQALSTHLNGYNAGFIRPDSALSMIVISDEDDSSDMFGVAIDPFVSFINAFKPDPAMISVSTIVGPIPDGCATADPAFQYHELRSRAVGGGEFHSICAADWANVLDSLAQAAASLRREFFLGDIPIVDTLSMWVVEDDGTTTTFDLGADFTYDPIRNSVRFVSYVPGPYAEVFISYDVDWGASQ